MTRCSLPTRSWQPARHARPRASRVVTDMHSRLNTTTVLRMVRPRTMSELADTVRCAAAGGEPLSICGRRHAMGGQQFGTGMTLVDTSSLDRVVDVDAARGLVTVEAGIDWGRLVHHLLWAFPDPADAWGIIQKQTGADRLTIGGSVSANIHGRGLRLRPFIGDIESLDLVDARGQIVTCSRSVNRDLFSLTAGGYGLFGPIARVTLRLARRRKLQRRVEVVTVDNLPQLFAERVEEGYEYGDFQFAPDAASADFLRRGVFSCYRPVPPDTPIPIDQSELAPHEWRRLLRLTHTDKSRAFAEYARYYLSTEGQVYWSDLHQLSYYPDDYHAELDRDLGAAVRGSEMITELYVPRPAVPEFMRAVAADARQHGADIVYGTVRVIERDDESVLAWAREPWGCIVFNLHVDHTPEGIARAGADFRRLIDRAIELRGSYYLTYHRWATAQQVMTCHPRIGELLEEKGRLDPAGLFRSDWHDHYKRLLGIAS